MHSIHVHLLLYIIITDIILIDVMTIQYLISFDEKEIVKKSRSALILNDIH